MSIFTDLLDQAVETGDLDPEERDRIVAFLTTPEPVTVEDYIRARWMEVVTNVVVYGSHPPPEEPQVLEGIRAIVGLAPEDVSITPTEAVRAGIDQILKDPLYGLDRART